MKKRALNRVAFRTGDVAEMMGISNSGVIFLEKRGIIRSSRNASGYRYFDDDSITRLGMIRGYERAGFELKEALELIGDDEATLMQRIDSQYSRTIERLRILTLLRERISSERNMHACFDPARAEICEGVAFYYCPYWENYYDMDELTPQECQDMRDVDKSWLAAIPDVRYCGRGTLSSGEYIFEKGSVIEAGRAHELGLLLRPCVQRIELERCLHFCYDGSVDEAIGFAAQHAATLRETLGSTVLSIMQKLSLAHEPGSGIHEYWISLKKIVKFPLPPLDPAVSAGHILCLPGREKEECT